jgi:hypothetical protein
MSSLPALLLAHARERPDAPAIRETRSASRAPRTGCARSASSPATGSRSTARTGPSG